MAHYDRGKLTEKAMGLWHRVGEDYRTKISRYESLLAQKRELKLLPLRPIRKRDLKEYPKIPFLDITEEDKAEEFLRNLPDHRLASLVDRIEYVINCDYTYCSLTNKILEYSRQIRNRGQKKSPYAMDPDRCYNTGGRQRSHHGRDYD